ncbi:serine hydrolase domain-containing protein [Paenibacillus terrigena]|uniref:serine hydrolase domain-containing protein n=1 Tax=Paenibacillus terrigena TaxID=369333 RepID=UPI0012EB15C3|nr:serine hydrolase domain-containing protein [Paenibacillus terrigena]
MEHYHVSGMSMTMIRNGQIHKTETYGVLEAGTSTLVDQQTLFNACSISKFVSSMLVMKLASQGILDLDENVNDRLTSWKVPNHTYTQACKVTLRTLLSHQSGIIDPKSSFTELDPNMSIPTMANLLIGNTPYCKESIIVKYEPGSDFHYSDAGFCIIQQLIEDVTRKPYGVTLDEHLFKPLHMSKSTILTSIPSGNRDGLASGHHRSGDVVDGKYPIYPYPAAAGLWSTSTDLARLVIELMDSIRGQSKIGISEKYAREMVTSQGCREWTGLDLFLEGNGQDMVFSSLGWGVGFQCMIIANPYVETATVIMTNTDTGVHQLEGLIGEILRSESD